MKNKKRRTVFSWIPAVAGKTAKISLFSLVVLVFSIGLLFTAEIFFRFVSPITSKGALIDVTLFPYKHYVVTTHPPGLELGKSNHILEGYFGQGVCTAPDGVTARFNSDGFRTAELKNIPPKEPGEIRIILTGGSASISWNIGEACTLDANLYKLFAKHYPNRKIRIFNLGNGAWKSFQELIALQQYGLKLQPDIIIAFDGFNDIQHAYSLPIEQPYTNTAQVAFDRYEAWVKGSVFELFKNLKMITALKEPAKFAVGMVGRTFDALGVEVPLLAKAPTPGKLETRLHYPLDLAGIQKRSDFDPHNQDTVAFYLRNQQLMARAAESVGAKMVFITQPILYLKTPLSEHERKSLESYAHSVNFVVQGYLRIIQGLQLLASLEKNARFVDMSNVFENHPETIFGDYCHFSKEGYEIVSEKIFSIIQNTLSL